MAATLSRERVDAVVLDLDGVLTDTARVHAAAWRRLFDDYLLHRPETAGENHAPFTDDDYRHHVDGRPRYDGVRAFLASRGIALPPEALRELGDRKDRYFLDAIAHQGVRVFDDAPRLLRRLREAGIRPAVISASRHCATVLESVGLLDVFDARVDGRVADELHLPGKPDPAVFLEAVRRLDVAPSRAVVVEDAEAGVAAGAAGGFGLVVGVDRTGHGRDLLTAGAHVVVPDLDALEVTP